MSSYFSPNDLRMKSYVAIEPFLSLSLSPHYSLSFFQVSDYICTLLSHAREISPTTYLKSVAASFREAWRMVDAIVEVAKQRVDSRLQKTMTEDVVWVCLRYTHRVMLNWI